MEGLEKRLDRYDEERKQLLEYVGVILETQKRLIQLESDKDLVRLSSQELRNDDFVNKNTLQEMKAQLEAEMNNRSIDVLNEMRHNYTESISELHSNMNEIAAKVEKLESDIWVLNDSCSVQAIETIRNDITSLQKIHGITLTTTTSTPSSIKETTGLDIATTESTTITANNVTTVATTVTSTGVSGRKFLLGFLKTYQMFAGRNVQCLITSDAAGALEIIVPYLQIYERRTLHAGENIVNLTYTIQANSSLVENKGIYIETTNNVNVYAMNFERFVTDGFTVIPIDKLSTEYVIATEEPMDTYGHTHSLVLVAATKDNTTVNFKFNTNGTIKYNYQTFDNSRDLRISLNRYETFQVEHYHDLTGTIISSSSPVVVVSGNDCGTAFGDTCSHLSEMIPPVKALGKKYIMPIFQASHYTNHYIRVIGTHDNTVLSYSINGQTRSTNLNKAESVDELFSNDKFMFLTASESVLVSVSVEFGVGDPFMTIVPAVNQYLSNYTFTVPSARFTSYGNIIIDNSFTSGLYLDGNLLSEPCSMVRTAFSNVQYCLMDIPLTRGYHVLYHNTGETFALFIYGRRYSDGYGFPAGMNFDP